MNKQKTLCLGLATLLLAGAVLAQGYLTLGEKDGLAEECEVRGYEGDEKTVRVQCSTGITNQPLSSFSAANQQKIMDWVSGKIFMSSSKLRVTIDREETRRRYEQPKYIHPGAPYLKGSSENVWYVIGLENRASIEMKNVTIEYRIFYETQVGKSKKKRKATGNKIFNIQPGKFEAFNSQTVRIRNEHRVTPGSNNGFSFTFPGGRTVSGGSSASMIRMKDRMKGISLCLSWRNRHGKLLTREYEEGTPPEEKKWGEYELVSPRREEPTPSLPPPTKPAISNEMIRVEGGTFMMGYRGRQDAPVHQVTVSPFEISKYETTQGEMARVMNWAYENEKIVVRKKSVRNNEREPDDLFSPKSFKRKEKAFEPKEEDLPFRQVSWHGAAAYCNYRSEMEGLKPCYKMKGSKRWQCDFGADGYRLPTEAEWEYAARGGASGQDTKYSGSDILDEVGWSRKTEGKQHGAFEGPGIRYAGTGPLLVSKMHAIALKSPNELGLYDMSGNVWEWCNDWYGKYSSGSRTNPACVKRPKDEHDSYRVIRGGNSASRAGACRVTARAKGHPEEDRAGFRVVRSVLSEEE